jgi:hypothetical protein
VYFSSLPKTATLDQTRHKFLAGFFITGFKSAMKNENMAFLLTEMALDP